MRIVRKDFKAWLQKHRNRTFYMSSPCGCPLAGYLTEKVGEKVYVTIDAYSDNWESRLPRWATDFVDAFDALPGYRVKGAKALALL